MKFRNRIVFQAPLLALALVLLIDTARADYGFGDFEGSDPGTWGYWSGGVQTPLGNDPNLEYSTEDATLNSTSVKATNVGYDQNLAYAADFATREAFLNATSFQFDVVVPATVNFNSGYWQIYELVVNSPAGFNNVTPTITNTDGSANNIYWGGAASGERRVVTFTVDYSTQVAAWGGSVPGYVELVFSLNNDNVHNTAYLDNFRINTIPEPTSLGLCGFAVSTLLLARRGR